LNQNRAQRFPAGLLAALGLILGLVFGLFLDQAASLSFNGNLWPALSACNYCVEAAIPVALEIFRVNHWTLLGSLVGLLAGVVIEVLPRLRPPAPVVKIKRLSGFRQAAELARFSRVLSDSLELQPILNQLHEEVLRITGADCGSSFLLDPASPEHRVAWRAGEGGDLQRLGPMEAMAVSTGRSRIVQDFEIEGEAPPHVGVRSALLVPITHQENVIGLIHLHSEQPGAFDNEFNDFVQALAAQAAVAIQNAQRYGEQAQRSEALRLRVNQLQQLSQIPNAVRVDRSLGGNLKAIAQSMQETADFSLVLISVFAPAGNQLVHTAAAGLSPDTFENLQHLPLPWERVQPFLREENRSERVYRVPHTQTSDLYQALDLGRPKNLTKTAEPGQWHPDDMLLVPLYSSRGEIDGLLSAGAPRDTSTPQSLVLDMLEVFASQAALAIENAQLVTQAEQRVSESQERAVQLSVLTEAAGVIASALHSEEVVTLALDQLRRVIPYDTAIFWQRELSDGSWRALGARSFADAIERVIGRVESAQATVFSEIVSTRSVVFVPDLSRDERFAVREVSTMRSWLGVPVLSSGEVTGILSLEKSEDNFYGAAQVPVALSFANRVAVALDNARLYEQSVQRAQDLEQENTRRAQDIDLRAQRLTVLNRVATDLAQARDLAAVLELSLDTLRQALGAAQASGLIIDGDAPRDSAHVLASAHSPKSATAASARLELAANPMLDRLQETGAPLIAEAAGGTAESVARPEHFAWVGAGVEAALFLPLLAEGRLVGVIGLGGRKFTVADAELGRAIVQQTVTALQYLQLRERAQEQSGVQQVTRAIGRATDFSQLYQVIRLQLAEVGGIQSLSLALYDSARNRVSFPLIVEGGQPAAPIQEADGRTPGGIVGHIVQTRLPVRLSGDVAAQAKEMGLALGLPNQHPVRGGPEAETGPLAQSYLGVPLLLGDKLIGALVAQDPDRRDALDERVERLLTAAGAQIALAVDNLRLFEQARQTLAASQERATHFETLTEAAVALASTLHSDEVIAAALDQMRRLVPYEAATFWQREGGAARRRGTPARWQAAAARGKAEAASRAGQLQTIEPRTPLGDALAARRTQVVPDTRQDARFENAGQAGAWMAVPVVSQGEVVALIELEAPAAGALTAAQAPLAQSLSSRIAQALNNAEQYEASLGQKNELAEQARRLGILNRAAVALSGLLDQGEVLSTTLRLMSEALSVERVGLMVFDDVTSKPVRAARQPAAAEPDSAASLAANPLVERLRQAGRVVSLDELAAEQPVAPEQTAWVGGGVSTGLFRPLVFGGRTVGLLGAGQAQAGRAFTAAEVGLAQELCRFAAAAIYEAGRYESVQEQLGEQALVNQIARAISQALDARQLGQLLRAQLDAWLAPAHVWLALYDEARHEVSFALAVADGQTVTLAPQAPDNLLRLILQTQQPLLLPGGAELAQQLQAAGLPADALGRARGYLGVPLVLGSAEAPHVVGVLALADPARAPRLTDSHQRVLAAVATQVAISLDNARLYAVSLARVLELDERAQRLAWLNQTAAELGSTLALDAVLPVALRALTELLPAEQAGVVLFDDALENGRVLARLPAPAGDQPAVTRFSLAGQGWWERLMPRLRESPAPLPLTDLGADANQGANPLTWLGARLASALLLPLHGAAGLIGLIALGRSQGRAFSGENVEFSGILVGHIVAALDNTIQFERSQERLSEQALVNQISRALSRTLDLRQLLDTLQAQMEAWLGPARQTLALLDDTRHELSFPLAVADGRALSLSPSAPAGILGYIIQSQQPLLLPDREAIDKQAQALEAGDDSLAGVQAFLGVPLVVGSRVLGVFTLANPQRVPTFDERHLRSLATLASQVALTVENARLYDMAGQAAATAQQRAAQLSTLAETLSAVTAGQRVSEVVEIALHQLQLLLPCERAAFWQIASGAWAPTAILASGGRGERPAALPEALSAQITTTISAALVADAGADPRFAASAERPGAWMGVPVVAQNEVVGILALESAQAGTYQAGQLPLAQAFAQQVGLALENARRYEDSLQRAQEFERRGTLLARAAAEFSGNLDLNSLLAVALRTIVEPLAADQAGIVIYATPPNTVDLTTLDRPLAWAQFPAADSQAAPPLLLGNPLFERLRLAQAPVPVDDLPESRLISPEQAAWVGDGLAAAVFFPLLAAGRQFGALGLGYARPHTFSPAELELGQTLAGQAAAAANNALRFFDLQQRFSEQTIVNQIVRTVGRAGDVEQMIEILRVRLGTWVPSDNVMLALYDEARNEMSVPLALENGRARETAPFAPGGILRHVLQTRHALRLGGDVISQCRELGIPISFIAHRPLRWTADPNDVLTASAYLGVPILFGDKALGVLAVESSGRGQGFSEYHERVLATAASQVALVIDNRRLFEQTSQALAAAQERVTQLEALAAALSVIASALYSEDVVGVTLEQFERVIPYDRAAFWRREAGAGAARELRWRAADARGYTESAEQLTQMLVADSKQLALFAEVVSTRHVVIVADTAQDARFDPGAERPTRSWLGVPLVNKGEVIGLLIAEKIEPNTYRSSHAVSAQILSSQITAVLTNTYEYEESVQRVLQLDERSRRLSFLNRFAAELGGNLNLGSILQLTLKALAESLGVDQATAAVFDDTRTAVLAMEHYPELRGARQLALPGSSLIERLQEAPDPITVEDLAGPEAPARLRQADWIGQEVRAAMFLPLTSAGKLIGLIGLGQSMAGRRFTPGETELSMGLANLAAVAAQNARQYDRTQQRLAEQAGINQITRALARTQEPRALLANLREQIEAWVGADQIYLAAYDESRNEVSFPLAESGGQDVNIPPRAPAGLVRHLLQQLEPVRLNGEIAGQLKDQGIYDTGLATATGLDETAAWTSCLGVPLVNDVHVVGALILANPKRAETFDESHERILSSVAAQVAAALGQARQFEQSRQITLATQTRAAQLSLLSEAASVIATGMRSEQVVELALDQLQRVIAYDSASLWRQNAAEGHWRLAAARGPAAGQVGQSSTLSAPEQDPLAEVAATRGALVIADAGLDGRLANRAPKVGSWLGVPLISKGQLLGLIAIEKAQANSYSADLASLAMAFANQAAVSLANVAQYEDSLRRAFELDQRSALLNRASARLSQATEPGEVLAAALQALGEAIGAQQGAALLFEDSRGHARTSVAARLPATQAEAPRLPLADNVLLNQLRASLAPVAAADLAADSLILPEYAAWIGPDIQSALFLPLAIGGRLIGLIGLGDTVQRGPFSAGDLELAMTLANQAAIAAHSARLYQETQQRTMELAAIGQSSRSITQAIDLKHIYDSARTQIQAELHADSFYVALFDAAINEVTYPLAVERGQSLELGRRAPDRLIDHILHTRQSLLLTGEDAAQLEELGLRQPAEAQAEPAPELRAKAYLGVPLISGANLLGVLAVQDFQRAFAFTDVHERGLANIALPLAAAVQAARLNEASAQRALAVDLRAALLGRLSAELGDATSLSTVVQYVARMYAETFSADAAAALVLDEAPGALLPLACGRFPDDAAGELPVFVAANSPLIKQLQTTLAPITLDELSRDPQARAELTAWLGRDVGAALFLPLITADKLLGLVAVAQQGHERHFTTGEVDLAMALASQAAIAAANTRLQEKTQPRLAELAAISRICQAIGGAASLAQLGDIIVAEVGAALSAETIILAAYDAASEAFSFPLLYSDKQRLTAGPRAPAGLLARVLARHASVLLNGQVEAELEQLGLSYQPVAAGLAAPQSALAVPLMLGSQVIGVLAVEDRQQVGHFTPSHEFILNTVAAPIAAALDNLHLQAERQVRGQELALHATQLGLLNRLSTSLMGSLDAEAILRRTLEELASALPLSGAAALLLDTSGPTTQVSSLVRLPAPGGPTAALPDADSLAALLQALRPAADPLTINDLANDQRLGPTHLTWLAPDASTPVVAVVLLPIIIDEKLAGLIGLARGEAGQPFLASEIELAAACSSQAAMAMTSARLYVAARQSRQRLQEQTRLAEASAALTGAATVESVVDTALKQWASALPCDLLAFYRLEGARLRLIGSAGRLSTPEAFGQTIDPAPDTFLAGALAAPAPLTLSDAAAEVGFSSPVSSARPAPRSWMGVPLRLGDAVLGLLALASAEPGVYGVSQAALAQSLAGPLAAALDTAERQAAAQQRADSLATELHEQSARSQEAQRQVEQYQALVEQSQEKAELLARQLEEQAAATARLEAEHSQTAQSLAGELQVRTEALQAWHKQVAALLENQPALPQTPDLERVLSQELLIASRAVGAEAGAIYLSEGDSGYLTSRSDYGLAEQLPAGIAHSDGLIGAAAAARQTIVVDDLLTDPRWGAEPAAAMPEGGAAANGAAANGANSSEQASTDGQTLADGDPPALTGSLPAAPASNGHYRSALAVPLLNGDQATGVMLFLSASHAAFGPGSQPLAEAAASQLSFAIHATAQEHTWREQAEALQRWLAEAAPLLPAPTAAAASVDASLVATAPVAAAPLPAAGDTIRQLPMAPARPETGSAAPARPVPAGAAPQTGPSAWRRLALPAGALLLVLCLAGGAVMYGGALKQAASSFIGGAAASASPAATSPATTAPTAAGAATTLATSQPAAIATASATLPAATVTPPATATVAATETPVPTASPLPSASPTAALPPDVIGLATVVLPDGVAGRLRDAPNGQVIGGVPGNTLVHILSGRQTTSDNIVWVHIRLPNTGQTGWFAESLLKYTATPVPQ